MTKLRPSLTYELALTQIAVQIGWDRVAEIAGQAERTVRNWSDPDTPPTAGASITLDLALALDAAFRAAGGEGAPMLQCYSTRLEVETAEASADSIALQRQAAIAAKEGGEAIAAVIEAGLPGATEQIMARAEVELQQSIDAQTNTLATLRAGRRGKVQSGSGAEGTARSHPGEGTK